MQMFFGRLVSGNLQKYDRDPVIKQAVQSRFATTLH